MALQLDASLYKAHFRKGQAYQGLGDFESAQRCFKKALEAAEAAGHSTEFRNLQKELVSLNQKVQAQAVIRRVQEETMARNMTGLG